MEFSPEAIESKQFAMVRRGVDPDEVAVYLRMLAMDRQALDDACRALRQEVAELRRVQPAAPATCGACAERRADAGVEVVMEIARIEAAALIEEARREADALVEEAVHRHDAARVFTAELAGHIDAAEALIQHFRAALGARSPAPV